MSTVALINNNTELHWETLITLKTNGKTWIQLHNINGPEQPHILVEFKRTSSICKNIYSYKKQTLKKEIK